MRTWFLAAPGLVALSLASITVDAQEWPRFRGNEAGVAPDDPALPERWSPTENVVWTAPIPGIGWSSPVVWGDHVFITTVVNTTQQEAPRPGFYLGDWPASGAPHRWMVYDIDFTTGKVRWEREVDSAPPGKAKHLKNSYASETAVTDGERVYFYFANAGVFVFDLNGTPVWSTRIGPFKTRNNWGTGASPVLHGDRLYIVNDNDEQSFLAAYDKKTGTEAWRVNRAEGTNWSSPFVWRTRSGPRSSRPAPIVCGPTTCPGSPCGSCLGCPRSAFRRRLRASAFSTSAPATSVTLSVRRTPFAQVGPAIFP